MGIDAIAVVHCTDQKLLKKLRAGVDHDDISLSFVGGGRDFVSLFTGVRMRDLEGAPGYAQMLAHRIVEVLPSGAHVDEEMIFYPDVYEARAETFDALVRELGNGCVRASTHDLSAAQKEARDKEWSDAFAAVAAQATS